MNLAATDLRVVITRPMTQATLWREQLLQAGIDAVIAPVLALRPIADEVKKQTIKNNAMDFDLFQKAIFVSQNAVEFGVQWLEDYWPQLPLGIEYFAVGETTARQLQKLGVKVCALTATESGAMNSESLLLAPELQQVDGEKIIIFRGCGGRGHMGDVLKKRGAKVTYCEVYERFLPSAAQEQLIAAFADRDCWNKKNIIALHSGESLQNYQKTLAALASQPATAELAEKLRTLPLLVPGQRVAQLAQSAGFSSVICAENATDKSMLAALLDLRNL